MRLPRILRTASFRLAAFYASIFAGSVLVLGIVVFLTARSALLQQMDMRLQAEMSSLEGEAVSGGTAGLVAAVERRSVGTGALDYLVRSTDGHRLAGDLPLRGEASGWQTIVPPQADASGDDVADESSGPESSRVLAMRLSDGTFVAVGDDLQRIDEANEAILGAFGWALALTVALGTGGGLLLSAGFLRRVDAVARTAEAIITGDLARRVPERGTEDDFDRLARTLNRMLDRIAALMESNRQVANDIAHDLRTPLARLRQRLEATRHGASGLADYDRAVEASIEETDAILETFAALLRIAQIEAGSRRAGFRMVDLSSVADSVVDAFAPVAEDEGRLVRYAIAPGIAVLGDRDLLAQLMANLVENAIRHTPPGTTITIVLGMNGMRARLTVADDGPGVPAAERARIFRRFHRLERSRPTPGNGLGLSLVASVAELHDAQLLVEDRSPGLAITIIFVAAPTSAHKP